MEDKQKAEVFDTLAESLDELMNEWRKQDNLETPRPEGMSGDEFTAYLLGRLIQVSGNVVDLWQRWQ